MSNLEKMLAEAAARPATDLPVGRLAALAANRRRRRRLVACCGAAVAALGIGVPGATSVLAPASDGVRVEIVAPEPGDAPPTTVTREEQAAITAAPVPSARPADGSEASVERAPEQDQRAATAPPPETAPAQDAAATPSGTSTPEGCRLPEPKGQDRDNASCSYVAQRAGGYAGSGSWSLVIVRGGQELRYSSVDSPPCAAVGLIQPGDRVRADLGAGAGTVDGGLYVVPAEASLEVGPSSHCAS